MTGIKPRRTLLVGTEPALKNVERTTMERSKAIRMAHREIKNSPLEMHKKVQRTVYKNHARKLRTQNNNMNVIAPNFTASDFFENPQSW